MFTERAFCFFFLLFCSFLEAFFIDREPFFFQNLNSKVYRESISVIEAECFFPGHDLFILLLHFFYSLCKNGKALIDRLIELFFFFYNYFKDKFFLFFQLRISIFRALDHCLCQFFQELSVNSEKTAMTAHTTKQAAKHISSSAV